MKTDGMVSGLATRRVLQRRRLAVSKLSIVMVLLLILSADGREAMVQKDCTANNMHVKLSLDL